MANEESIKWLYGKLKSKGYDIGDNEDEFKSYLSDDESVDWCYDRANEMGLNVGDREAFRGLVSTKMPDTQSIEQENQTESAPSAPAAHKAEAEDEWVDNGKTPMSDEARAKMAQMVEQAKSEVARSNKEWNANVDRIAEQNTEEGRKRIESGKMSAVMAGTPTKVAGFSVARAKQGSGEGEEEPEPYNTQTAAEEADETIAPVKSEKSPQPYGVVMEDGQAKTQWLMPDGTLTTSLTAANEAEASARDARMQHAFFNRMRDNGLDPENQNDIQAQMVMDEQKPMRDVVDDLWAQAVAQDKADEDASRKEIINHKPGIEDAITGVTPTGMMQPTMHTREVLAKRATKTAQNFDLERMADDAFNNLPQDYKDEQILAWSDHFREHPEELNGRSVADAAADALKHDVAGLVYEKAVKMRAPKSTLEFFGRKLMDGNPLNYNATMDLYAAARTGNYGLTAAEMDAMGHYESDHGAVGLAGTIGGMTLDPITYISSGFGSLVSKGAMKVGAKAFLRKMSEGSAQRYLANRLIGRTAQSAIAGSANFAMFEGLHDVRQQIRTNGLDLTDPVLGNQDGFDIAETMEAAGHGAIMGAATGVLGPGISKAGDAATRATASTLGKAAVRTGQLGLGIALEGTVFSIPEWMSGERDAMDVWTDNLAMMAGFKLSHAIKTAPQTIASLRPIAEPKTAAERIHNRKSFAELVRNRLDASQSDLYMTKDEERELKERGYGDLAGLFVRKPGVSADKGAIVEAYAKHEPADAALDGYMEMERLVNDKTVSQSTRAKAYHILTGRWLPMSPAVGSSVSSTPEGFVVESIARDGSVITRRVFKSSEEASQETKRIARQGELNTIDMGEQTKLADAAKNEFRDAVAEVAPGIDPVEAERVYAMAKRGENVGEAYAKVVEDVDRQLESNKGSRDAERPNAIRAQVEKETGVDVEQALRKQPERRDESERFAVLLYGKRLYEKPRTEEQRQADEAFDAARLIYGKAEGGDPNAKAEMDAMSTRLDEAKRKCEEVFGEDMEQTIAELGDNVWESLQTAEMSAEQRAAVLEYLNAKSAVDGVVDASNNSAEAKREQAEKAIQRRTDMETGMVRPVTMKVGDKQMFVVRGNLVTFEDGTINVRESDSSLVVCDPETGDYKFISPDQIMSAGQEHSPEDELTRVQQEIQTEQETLLTPRNMADEYAKTSPNAKENETNEAQGTETPQAKADGENAAQTETTTTEATGEQPAAEATSALSRIPKDEAGEPIYDEVDKDLAWDALLEQTEGDEEMAQASVNMMLQNKETAAKKIEKAGPKHADTMAQIIANQKQWKQDVAKAKADLEHWQQIAGVSAERKKAEAERIRKEAAEAERKKAEGQIPDWRHDTPEAARERGYRISEGERYDRQGEVDGVVGRESMAVFSGKDEDIKSGNLMLVDIDKVQESHKGNMKNPYHFIPEAQPKDRTSAASKTDTSVNAQPDNFKPQLLTGDGVVYSESAPVVNSRGEVIQGNGRVMTMRDVYRNPESAAAYKAYLKEHAADFGLTPEDVDKMEHPILVNRIDVDDNEAIRLGQFKASDLESGGSQRIEPKETIQKMGDWFGSFLNKLFAGEEDASVAQLIDANGVDVLKHMNARGFISNTQIETAIKDGRLTAEGKNDIEKILKHRLFDGAPAELETMFNNMPVKAQKAILATYLRDYNVPAQASILGEIRESIMAFHELSQDESFMSATNYEAARNAILGWLRQQNMFDAIANKDKFSTFALELAVREKTMTQKGLTNLFNTYYDMASEDAQVEGDLFNEADNKTYTKAEAIKKLFDIDINNKNYGNQGSNVLGGNAEVRSERRPGSSGSDSSGERYAQVAESSDVERGSDRDNKEGREEVADKPRQQKSEGARPVTKEEAVLRDALAETMQKSGLDVIGSEEGQRVLDEANGKAKLMAFGEPYDYDVYPKGRVEPNLAEKDVEIVATDANHGFTNYKQAFEWGIKNLCRTYDEKETGGKGIVNITPTIINKYVSQAARDASSTEDLHYAVLRVLPELIRNGIDVETHPNFTKVDGVRKAENGYNKDVLIHRVYAAASVDGHLCRVKITMKENVVDRKAANKPYSYEVTDISTEIEPLEPIGGEAKSNPGISNNSISAAKLLKNVEMSYNPGVKVLDASEKRSEKVREHRVYHGSGADFDAFDHSHMGEGEGAQAYGWGTYVTEVEGIGRTYAENNPGTVDVSELEYDREKAQEDIAEKVLARYGNIDCEFEVMYNGAGGFEVFDVPRDEATLTKFREYFKEHEDEWDDVTAPEDYDLSDEYDRAQFARSVESSMIDYATNIAHDYDHLWSEEQRILYTVEIPDDNGSNYLSYDEVVPKNQVKKALDRVYQILVNDEESGYSDKFAAEQLRKELDELANNEMAGEDFQGAISIYLGGDKAASELLSSLGFVGIKYPAENMTGGRSDGAKNYVIFNESDAKITDKVRFFRTKDGEAYGFTVGGKIYFDPKIATSETLVHEYAHLWATALKSGNPEEWKNVVELMKGTPVWEEVRKSYPELETEDEIADEVIAQYSGRKGAERLRAEQQKIADGNGGVFEKAEAISALQRVKRALDKFWRGVCDFLHIHYTSAEEVADRVMKDLLGGVDPRKFGKTEESAFAQKHGVGEQYVKAFADAMREGNLQAANWAMTNIRVSLRHQHTELKLSDFRNVLKPIQEELYSRFGNLDALQKEYEGKAAEERNMMEAARKKAEEEQAERNKRLEELAELSEKDIDALYLEAINNNDVAAAREMLDEAARRKGYGDTASDYQGVGAWAAPSNPGYESDEARRADVADNAPDVNLEDIALGYSNQPADYFDNPRAYAQDTPHGRESTTAIRAALEALKRGEKDVKVKVYRAVPTSVKEGKLRNGDWVTPSKMYAEMHGNNRLEGDYRIIEDEVPASQLWWDGNDANEWGFDDGKRYKYKNTKNNRKLNDLVTRDDNGNIILPSKRFNQRKSDIRFQFVGEKGAEAADHAEEATTRLDNLAVAREMEEAGSDAKAIKMATGWERGADTKWRYEIPDVDFVPEGNAGLNHRIESQPWGKECIALADRIFNGETLSEAEMKRFDELSEKADEVRRLYESLDVKYLDDYARSEELFNAYPELKQVKVEWVNDPSLFWAGGYSEEDNTIYLNKSSVMQLDGILVHEIQHVIQQIEGFAKGADPEDPYLKKTPQYKNWEEAAARLHRESPEEVHWNEGIKIYTDAYDKLISSIEKLENKKDAESVALLKYNKEKLRTTKSELEQLVKARNMATQKRERDLRMLLGGEKDTLRDIYRHVAGEVESRNVQKRMGMTPEERRASLAAETEDVSREDQIFLFGGGSESRSELPSEELHERVRAYDESNDTELGRFVDYIERGRVLNDGEKPHFKVGKAGDVLSRYGIKGNIYASTETENERRHTRNTDHSLTPSEWVEAMESVNNPLAITRYKGISNRYRVYTHAVKNGKSICLGMDVNDTGYAVEISNVEEFTDIRTAFGRDIEQAICHEDILYPEGPNATETIRQNFAQSSAAHNSQLYEQNSVSAAKVVERFETAKENGENLSEDKDLRFRTSGEIDAEYPNWLEGTTNDNGKHTTQIAGTVKTYQKVGEWIESNLGKGAKILDASSGMGLGTQALREQGLDIEDVEPYQSEERKASNPATYASYGDITGRYDYIISNAVLNVIPDDWRRDVLHDMAERLKVGGRLFINTRKAGEEKNIKDKIELDSPQEVLVKRNGKIASYQRFFTPAELKEWVEEELGEGYSVEVANEKNSGTKGLAAVVVTKTNDENGDLRFRTIFGGNRGYVGYSKSVRAVEAEERGLKSVSQMDRDFADEVSRMVSEELGEETMLTLKEVREAAKAGRYDEWHHTSMYGNKTKYYSAETVAENIVAAKREQDELNFQDRREREKQLWQAHVASRRGLIANEHGVTVKTKDRSGVNDWVTDDVFRSSNGYAIVVDNGPKKKGWFDVRVLNEGQEEAYYSPYLGEDYIYDHKDEINKAVDEYNARLEQAEQTLKVQEQDEMAARVEELCGELNTPVHIIRTEEEVNALPSERQRKMKGSFNTRTGEVTVVVPNNADVADVENTVLHEVVGHDGLRVLFPEQEKFNNAMDELYRVSTSEIREKIEAAARKLAQKEGKDPNNLTEEERKKYLRDATEEYGAYLAGRIGIEGFERMTAEEQTFWGKLKSILQKALDKLIEGLKIPAMRKWADKEWAYVMHEAYKRKKNGGWPSIYDLADTEVMRKNTGFGEEAEDGDLMLRPASNSNWTPEDRDRVRARDEYERKVKTGFYQVQEAFQDSMLGLKTAMESIMGKGTKVEDIDGHENPYLGENRLSSVNEDELKFMNRTIFDPLLDIVAEISKSGGRERLDDYMFAKHGLERNDVMARRDARRAVEKKYGKDLKKAEEAVNQNPNDPVALQALADLKLKMQLKEDDLYKKNRAKDYAGLTALTEHDPSVSGLAAQAESLEEQFDKEQNPLKKAAIRIQLASIRKQWLKQAEVVAAQMVNDYEANHNTDELWDKIREASQAILNKQHECGLLSDETYADISSMYQNYIPLRGFADTRSAEVYAYLNQTGGAFNAPIKKAKGRRSKADDPIANLKSMAESSIAEGNRNVLVKQRFLNFVENHPSDLASVSELWLRYDAVMDEWIPVMPDDILPSDDAATVAAKMQAFEQKMEGLAKADPDLYVHGKDADNIPYRVVSSAEKHQHQVIAKRNGHDYIITINGSPRAAQAINGRTNPDSRDKGAIGSLVGVVGDVNRTLSGLYTTYQPDFMASNFLRDCLYANTMVHVREDQGYAWSYNLNYLKLPKVMHLLGQYRKGTLKGKSGQYFKEFMENGGETGFIRLLDIDEHKRAIKDAIATAQGKMPAQAVAKRMGEWIGEIGRGIEMRARFAAYVTSREAGRSIDRSIWDAKEISVNFNKKGTGDAFFRENGQTAIGNAAAVTSELGRDLFVFFNAGVQGTFGNFIKAFIQHPGKMSVMSSLCVGLGVLVSALWSADDDDSERYFDQPKHTRRQNLLINGGDGTIIKVPLSIEQRVLYGLGEMLGAAMFHNEPLDAEDVMVQASQLLPVDMMEGPKALWPSSVKPLVEATNNETWYGSPIWKETPWNKHMPDWTKAYKSANPDIVKLAEELNAVSGGDKYGKGAIDINPAQLEYLLKQYTGGLFTVANQLRNMTGVAIGEKDFDWRYVPIMNRVVMNDDERNAGRGLNDKFFEYMDEYDAMQARFSAIKGDMSLPVDEKRDMIAEITRKREYPLLRRYSTIFKKLNTAKNNAEEAGDKEKAEELSKKLTEIKKELVNAMEQQQINERDGAKD